MYLHCSHGCLLVSHITFAISGNTRDLCCKMATCMMALPLRPLIHGHLFHDFTLNITHPIHLPEPSFLLHMGNGNPLKLNCFLPFPLICVLNYLKTEHWFLLHSSEREKGFLLCITHFQALLRPIPLLVVVFLYAIRYSSKQRLSFVCSNALMTSQSIQPYSFIRNWENACYLLRLLQVVGLFVLYIRSYWSEYLVKS